MHPCCQSTRRQRAEATTLTFLPARPACAASARATSVLPVPVAAREEQAPSGTVLFSLHTEQRHSQPVPTRS